MSNVGRPLSPHLTIYRWPITMVLSILHRFTGVALSVGFLVFVFWLEAIAYESVPYDSVAAFLSSLIGRLMLFGWCFAFFLHLANGVRHLVWDSGRMFAKHQVDRSSWLVLAAAAVLTGTCWLAIAN